MKRFFKITPWLFLLFMVSLSAQGQFVSLPKEVKFNLGDDMVWASQSFDDTDWGNRQLGASLNDTTVRKNIYAWYRIKVLLPSGMKEMAEKGNGITLQLGKIDDIDQTFFNGKMIGQTGSFPPDYQSRSQATRVYIIPPNEVQWDRENLISIRVFSHDSWVGMYEGPYRLGPVQWSDSISVEQTIVTSADNGFTAKVKFLNKGSKPFEGSVRYRVSDVKNNELFYEVKPVNIQPQRGAEKEIYFSAYKPVQEKIFKVGYTVTEKATAISMDMDQLFLADKQMKIAVDKVPVPVVPNKIKDVFTSIRFQDQQQKGYLGRRLNQNLVERLLKLDEVGTLDGYLSRPGHHPWAGEHIGKYLETASNVWKNTGDERLKVQMDRLMYQLINAQLPDGYLGTYAPEDYWTSWDVWSHKYNLYGLLGYYTATGYLPALEACKKMGDLLCKTFGNNPGQQDIILAGTHVGMASTSVLDPMVELYKYTGDKKYLDFCYYILNAWEQKNGPKIISALLSTGTVNKVGNGKAYEMLSCFVGLANLYRVTGDEKLLDPLLIAWKDIVENRLYITGTTSSHEYFQKDEYFPADRNANMGEGCVTTTWVQFNHQLLSFTGDVKYLDQIETAIYNHLLAAENPQSGCVSYYTPLMGAKPYTCNITCCQSSVPRGISMLPFFTFGNINKVPTLMMYEPALYVENIKTADNKNIRLTIDVASVFPENGNAVITVKTSQAGFFPIALRVPLWSKSLTATIGSKMYKAGRDRLIVINRTWKSGDKINVSFQMPVQMLSGGKSYPDQYAFQRGPQVLAMDSLLNNEMLKKYPMKSGEKVHIEKLSGINNTGLLPKSWIGQQAYIFNISDKANPAKKLPLVMVPFADASQTGGVMKVWLPVELPR